MFKRIPSFLYLAWISASSQSRPETIWTANYNKFSVIWCPKIWNAHSAGKNFKENFYLYKAFKSKFAVCIYSLTTQLDTLWMAGVQILARARFILFSKASKPALRPTQSPIQWILGPLSLGIKQHGREADHSLPSSAEVKNGGTIPLLPHTSLWHGA
jgi:hypothetical protein